MSARLALAAPIVALVVLAGRPAAAFCPSYTLSSVNNNNSCGVEAANGTNPSTAEWNTIFDLVSQGPAVWGNAGPAVSDIGQGCGKPEPLHNVPARFPCELLKGIAEQESGWRQFCVPDTPSDQVGGPSRTIISFDCGYGIGQVTSGMHIGETPSFDRQRVAADPTYNLATGTQILASKWKATNCVGDNQPAIIEDWYIATWAYNGLAYVNNPNNPNYDPNRGVWNPNIGGGAPYQEKVFGRMEYSSGWTPTALAYPNPGDIGGGSVPPELPEPDCASPTDCVNARSTHPTACNGQSGTGGSGGSVAGTGGSPAGAGGTGAAAGGAGGALAGPAGTGGAIVTGGWGEGGGDSLEPPAAAASHCACQAVAESPGQLGWMALLACLGLWKRRRRTRSERA